MSVAEWLARNVAFPLYERLRGRPTLAEMRSLARLLQESPERVQAVCRARLRELLAFADARLPFYTQRFAASGLDPASADAEAELARLPALHKPDVRANADAMVYAGVPGGLQPAVSGGTSGDTLHFYVDHLRQAQSMSARLVMQALFGVRPGDRRMWVWGSPIELRTSRLRRVRDRLINELVLDAFELGPVQVDAYLGRIHAYQPRLLIGYPGAVTLLARRAAQAWGPSAFRHLRAAVLTGDEVHADHRAAIQAGFGCPAVSEYGSREVGLIAHECPRRQHHVLAPHIFVEITQNGRRLPIGHLGNVTCTNLNSRAQPLIRYDIGDVGALSATGCDCGLPLPVLKITAARRTGFVVLPGGRLVHGHLVAYLVRAEPSVVEFKVFQRSLQHFDVLLTVNARFSAAVTQRIEAAFRHGLGEQITVRCRVVDRIPPDPSGKRRHFVSTIAADFAQVGPSDAAPFRDWTGAARPPPANHVSNGTTW